MIKILMKPSLQEVFNSTQFLKKSSSKKWIIYCPYLRLYSYLSNLCAAHQHSLIGNSQYFCIIVG
jgi:hypothetical protein